jgi:tRNA1(Val) A37 N6-methylase TrmN6
LDVQMAIDSGDFFKGWAKPGPRVNPPADVQTVGEGETLDAISGHFRIFQLKDGHRFSTDDILTAWYGTSHCPTATRVLDLGSGIGSVGMVAAWRLPGAHFVTVEAQDASVALARKSARYNGLEGRYEIRQGDFRDPAVIGADEKFDLVLGSPPYFPLGSGVLGDHPQKIACRFEVRGTVANYCLTAAKHLALGGWFACVFPMNPPEQLARVEEGAREAGLTIVRRRPIVLREGEPPLLCLFAMVLSEHLPEAYRGKTWVEPDLIVRRKDGTVHPEYSAVKLSIGFPP